MIKHVAAREKNARVDIDYPQDGLTCRIAFEREKGVSHRSSGPAE
jgi:hypothetical protein